MFVYPLNTLDAAIRIKRQANPFDRVMVGKALAGMSGTIFTTESGAIPYYSGWKAVDVMGLNCRAIAKGCPSYQFLKKLNPDVIMLRMAFGRFPENFERIKLNREFHEFTVRYIKDEGYMAEAAILKGDNETHVYFVHPKSRLSTRIINALRDVKKVHRLDLRRVVRDDFLPKSPA
jgi:hypothetical protein